MSARPIRSVTDIFPTPAVLPESVRGECGSLAAISPDPHPASAVSGVIAENRRHARPVSGRWAEARNDSACRRSILHKGIRTQRRFQ